MGHMDSMAPSNISRAQMVEQNYKGEQSSLNSERPSSASSNYNKCSPRSMGATLQIVKNNKFFKPEEVKKLTLTEIFQSTMKTAEFSAQQISTIPSGVIRTN
jgi:hypothetical protein